MIHLHSAKTRRVIASGLGAAVLLTGLAAMSRITGDTGTGDAGTDYDAILAGEHRSEAGRARDIWRHPAETLRFMGLEGDMSVAEIWPGGGWYLKVIAPALKAGGGTYYAVTPWDPASDSDRVQGAIKTFDETIVGAPDIYGTVHRTLMRGAKNDIAPDGSLDMVLTFRNVHNWLTGDEKTDFSQAYMDAFFRALKPGGTLGVVEHRARDTVAQDPAARSGYVHVAQVKALATAAGFEFVGSSEVNANPLDTGDHPFGVWTLPPTRQSPDADQDADQDAGFDRAKYDAIGESDRMTLKFRKPKS